MDSSLRVAWTDVVTADDYEQHMAAIGQAQAAAALTAEIVRESGLPANSRILVIGAGTGQMFDFIDPALLRPFELICTDLNPTFLGRLSARLRMLDIRPLLVVEDIESTAIAGSIDLLLASLLFEQIDWRKGVEAVAALGPRLCGVIIQQNPEGMTTAVTPNRRVPDSLVEGFRTAQPKLLPHAEFVAAFERSGYTPETTRARDVADSKQLVSTVFRKADAYEFDRSRLR